MDEKMATTEQQQKLTLELLTKEEIINKYKSLLIIAKKAKQAKDESSEENRKLKELLQQHETQKEADKKSLLTMKEMVESYTENKLQLTNQVSELQKQRRMDVEALEKLSIENECVKRQLQRLSGDNDSLLADLQRMEQHMQQINVLGHEQKQHLELLEDEVGILQQAKSRNEILQQENVEISKSLQELKQLYELTKENNNEQKQKFKNMKDRFIEVLRKLKKLKECKRVLLETQHEYADSVSQWQNEIIHASQLLCKEFNVLKSENAKLLRISGKSPWEGDHLIPMKKLNALLELSETACQEHKQLQEENVRLLGRQEISIDAHLSEHQKPFEAIKRSVLKLEEISRLAERVQEDQTLLKLENDRLQRLLNISQSENGNYGRIFKKLDEMQHLSVKAQEEFELKQSELQILEEKYQQVMEGQQKFQSEEKDTQELLEKLKNLKEDKLNLICKLDELEAEKQSLAENVLKLERSCAHLNGKLSSTQKSLEDLRCSYKKKETEHTELLNEMRELNEALKARGDMISRQQNDCQLLQVDLKKNSEKLQQVQEALAFKEKELDDKQAQLKAIRSEVEDARQKMESLENCSSLNEEKVRVLRNELETLKTYTQTSPPDQDNQSDLLSTSSISKGEELQCFKEEQDSFEDKYQKVRSLAAKFKKKLLEQTALNQDLEEELANYKSKQAQMQQDFNHQQHVKQTEMDNVQQQLLEAQKQVDTLKVENQKLRSSRKQANVLNLEIEAAEKSLTDVSVKLAARTTELSEMQDLLITKETTIKQLRQEIHLLESAKESEINHSQELKEQIDHLQKTLKDMVYAKQQALDASKSLEHDVENLKLEFESARMQLSAAASQHDKALNALSAEKEELMHQFRATQEILFNTEQRLKTAERATEDLRVEYLDYKVKAQAVLRKNQTRDITKEKELEEELLMSRTTEHQLRTTVQTLNTKLEMSEKQNELLNDDQASLQKRCKELMEIVEESRAQNESLAQELQQKAQQQHEILKQHRLQIETVNECHKEQIQSLVIAHKKQIEQLHKEMNANQRVTPSIGASKTQAPPPLADMLQAGEQSKIDFLLMEREDAEGSEEALATLAASRKISNASSNQKRGQHDFMPLDELLNTPINAINSETLLTNNQRQISESDNNPIGLLQLDLHDTKERLQMQESRVRHLTALLAENEQDLAKFTQMNDILKEELRRQERCSERQQHMHNSEYLKNVIMKFLTLNNSDERIRLVPVLNTILKLSRTETEMLNCVAKGQKVVADSSHRSGWGNFLPSWGGAGNINNN
ncbi:GRIP and coiled-coil domain-containing protein 2 [Glossina fuscipes]|uniref:GRIP and coiled-coil domain-containing protein 2 n=1 Tax=Glossina fuscipes TaxID=7396 RepID=A0A9C5Z3G7_9MUSC|nr:GRIP and coiled-coil domain-containing protein 2 [Glossina fuscipes]